MKRYCATFGFGQYDPASGEPLANCYTIVHAEDRVAAHQLMTSVYGNQWSFLYDNEDQAGVDTWGLREIPFPSSEQHVVP